MHHTISHRSGGWISDRGVVIDKDSKKCGSGLGKIEPPPRIAMCLHLTLCLCAFCQWCKSQPGTCLGGFPPWGGGSARPYGPSHLNPSETSFGLASDFFPLPARGNKLASERERERKRKPFVICYSHSSWCAFTTTLVQGNIWGCFLKVQTWAWRVNKNQHQVRLYPLFEVDCLANGPTVD